MGIDADTISTPDPLLHRVARKTRPGGTRSGNNQSGPACPSRRLRRCR
jgi:hypothetical protein